MMVPWTRRDSANQNAVDTCKENGLRSGTADWQECWFEMYHLTLAMLIDDPQSSAHCTPECEDCERQPYPKKCDGCKEKE